MHLRVCVCVCVLIQCVCAHVHLIARSHCQVSLLKQSASVNLEFTSSARSAGQWAVENLPSPPWDLRHTPPCPDFLVHTDNQNLHPRACVLTNWAILPESTTSTVCRKTDRIEKLTRMSPQPETHLLGKKKLWWERVMVGKGGNLYKSKKTKQNTHTHTHTHTHKTNQKQENHCFVCQCTAPWSITEPWPQSPTVDTLTRCQ